MEKKPYISTITYEQIKAFRPDDPATYTPSPLVNAVAEALYTKRFIEAQEFAEYLDIEPRQLRAAMQIEVRMPFINLIHIYRLDQADQYIRDHPDANLDTVAEAIGYASAGSLWRFYQRKRKETPLGHKSDAGEELWLKMRAESMKRKYWYRNE